MSISSLTDRRVEDVRRAIVELTDSFVDDGTGLPPQTAELVQAALLLGTIGYAALRQAGHDLPPYPADREPSATAGVITVSNILQAVDVATFELAMCQNMDGVAMAAERHA